MEEVEKHNQQLQIVVEKLKGKALSLKGQVAQCAEMVADFETENSHLKAAYQNVTNELNDLKQKFEVEIEKHKEKHAQKKEVAKK